MIPIRVIAIPTAVAESVRTTGKSPRYGHPAYTSLATGYGPCRHCLKTFKIGEEERTLFTYDAFADISSLPLPGPVLIHAKECTRYPETFGYPDDLRQYPSVLCAYGTERRLIAEVLVEDGTQPRAIQQLLTVTDVAYVHVRDKNAGCYDFRVEIA
jgi:hypothetical protein